MKSNAFASGLFKGVTLAMLAALLFGASAPLSKLLLGEIQPVMLAGLLYLGSGFGLLVWMLLSRITERKAFVNAPLKRAELPYLTGAILAGGVIAPVLLMLGLAATQASTSSLLLNLEGVFTAVLAWMLFKENCDRRIVLGMVAICLGGVSLAVVGQAGFELNLGGLLIVLACAAWAIDNNLTRNVSSASPQKIVLLKGLVAGSVNLALALFLGARIPEASVIVPALLVGFSGYGISLVLFVKAQRHLGTSRTSAYFSTAPFAGAMLSLALFQEAVTVHFLFALALMAAGLYLHMTERHEHEHRHEAIEHEHEHVHDVHHRHAHDGTEPQGEPHSHRHRHQDLTHWHPHYPDLHHRHEHEAS